MKDREHVLQIAIQDFGRYGVDRMSLQEIAFDASVPIDQVMEMFPTVSALLDGVMDYISHYVSHIQMTEEEIVDLLESDGPLQILNQMASSYRWDDNYLYDSIYRFLYAEQYASERMSALHYEQVMRIPMNTTIHILDILVKHKAIPPCDSVAVAEVLTRTSMVYGMLAIHGLDVEQEYADMVQFVFDMVIRGVRILPVEQLLEEQTPSAFIPEIDVESAEERDRVKRRALELFDREGYRNVTMDRIAQDLGMEFVYHHYRIKSDIVREANSEMYNFVDRSHISDLASRSFRGDLDPISVVRALSGVFPSQRQTLQAIVYKILLRDQFFCEELKDIMLGNLFLSRRTVIDALDSLCDRGTLLPCNSRMIASLFVFSMFSLTVEKTVYPREHDMVNKLRVRVMGLLVSLIVYGYCSEMPSCAE